MRVTIVKNEKNEKVIAVTVNKKDEEFILDKWENYEKFQKDVGESVGAELLAAMVIRVLGL